MNITINTISKKVQDIAKGDVVSSFDIKTGVKEYSVVLDTFLPIIPKERQYEIKTKHIELVTSDIHPMLVLINGSWNYQKTQSITVGQTLLDNNLEHAQIESIRTDVDNGFADPQFYDLNVAKNHNYYAGNEYHKVIVHNSSTVYYPFWHQEVEDLVVLKNNKGTEETRARKLDYNIQLSRLFYRRAANDEQITLFSPHEVTDLYDAFGDNEKFDALYVKYEADPKVKKKQISARELLETICKERIETGRLYIMNIDNVNQQGAFKDSVKMSNLCVEVVLPTSPIVEGTDDGEIAICVLSAVNLGALKDLSEMEEVCDLIVRSLDYIVGHQHYPVKAAEKMLKRRSLGIGITNLAYYLAKNKVGYDESAFELADRTFEYFQYYCLKASCQLAKESGPCEYFNRTKYSDGILPMDRYNKNVDDLIKRKPELDWDTLRANIKEFGLRNSVLTAQMPCESSAVVGNSTNGIEPPRSLISIKQSKQGLLKQVVPEINKIGHQYTTAWEMPDNKGYTGIAAIMQKWIDQSISTNHYYDFTKFSDGSLPLSIVVDDLFYSYQLGIKTLYYANFNDGKTDDDSGTSCAGGSCSV